MSAPTHMHPSSVRHLVDMHELDVDGALKRLQQIALGLMGTLRASAARKLNTSRADFLKGLQAPDFEVDGNEVRMRIDLEGRLPNMLEHGVGPYDLRATMLQPGRPGVKMSASGHLYRVVPFRHGGPNSKGHSGTPMGAQLGPRDPESMSRAHRTGLLSGQDARLAGHAARRQAKQLGATRSAPGAGVQWGDSLPEGTAPKVRARHATDLFAGMYRLEKTYERSTQDSFVSFRVISSNPNTHRFDSDGRRGGHSKAGAFNTQNNTLERNWTHPGIEARGVMSDAHAHLESILNGGTL